MKKIYNSAITLMCVLTFLTSTNFAHAQTATDIEGTWSADFQQMNTTSNYASKNYNDLPEQSRTRIKEAMESRTFAFNADQTATISFSVGGNSRQVNGTWSYQASEHLLTITVNSNAVEYRTTLQGNTLTLAPLVLEANAIFKSLSLTKN